MDHRQLGGMGVQVSKLALDTMMFGSWGNPDHDSSIDTIHRALDAGINFVGKAIAGRRQDIVLATKFWEQMGGDVNHTGSSRRWIIQEVENLLRRLGTDWIDLYQLHRPTPETDHEETLGPLSDLAQQGKIRYVGSSKETAASMVEAQWVPRDRRLHRYVTEKPSYSILARGVEAEVLPTASRYRLGVLTFSPLNGGWLSGRWRKGEGQPEQSPSRRHLVERFDITLPANQRKLDAVEALGQLADKAGLTLIELAIAFVLNHPAVTSAIIGPRTREHLDSQLSSADVALDPAVLDRIDEIVGPEVNLNPADILTAPDEPATRRR